MGKMLGKFYEIAKASDVKVLILDVVVIHSHRMLHFPLFFVLLLYGKFTLKMTLPLCLDGGRGYERSGKAALRTGRRSPFKSSFFLFLFLQV